MIKLKVNYLKMHDQTLQVTYLKILVDEHFLELIGLHPT